MQNDNHVSISLHAFISIFRAWYDPFKINRVYINVITTKTLVLTGILKSVKEAVIHLVKPVFYGVIEYLKGIVYTYSI